MARHIPMPPTLPRAGLVGLATAAAVATLALSGCTLAWQNVQPAQQVARQAEPEGSLYTGWRVFQDKCARCHGADAAGGGVAPSLLPRVRTMGPRRFVDAVLARYDWDLPAVPATGAAREAYVDDVLARRQGALVMPAFQAEPRVNAHVADLYAWLDARAQGTQGPGRPWPSSAR